MSIPPPGKTAGALPVFWRSTLFIGVLSMHGVGFALMPQAGVNARGEARAPAILQVSWIAGASAEASAATVSAGPEPGAMPEPAPPEPVAAPVKPKTPVKPRARTRAKPVLAKPADAPEPLAQTVAAYETQLREEASAAGPTPAKNPADEARGASAATNAATAADTARAGGAAGAAGQGAPGGLFIPPSHADYLSNPRPNYPAQSRAQGEQGVVSLLIRVSAEGRTSAVALHKTSGHERLDQAAMEAVWRWRFVPARQGGHPVAGAVIVPIRFNLRS
ncbi:MAG: TonB family protein [Candidatus Accumulibacter sp.]|jgi:protein TonB|nr:TonB family protein [Accumulibacter sp.]